jgi:hypothetical protein
MDILFEFDVNSVGDGSPYDQHNDTVEGKKLTEYTFKIINLIESDITEIVKFLEKYM